VSFQLGGETIDLVLLVMNEHGMKRLLEDKVTLGGEASVAGGPVGRDVRAMTDAQLKAEMLSYSRAQGLFAGVNLSAAYWRLTRTTTVISTAARSHRKTSSSGRP